MGTTELTQQSNLNDKQTLLYHVAIIIIVVFLLYTFRMFDSTVSTKDADDRLISTIKANESQKVLDMGKVTSKKSKIYGGSIEKMQTFYLHK